ncbi:F-box protein-like [Dorcoceras hygrometricum]|uniref:F-box protein-like n=1 Tax=Dorcoceras hygrometricum TaxID=472368 RepID=A0A2Z7D3W9_9LAMI|nr:F-box protein-like [Dorcoceras hygrometricum]
MRRHFGDATVNAVRLHFSDSDLSSGMMCPSSSDRSKTGSTGLLLSRPFFLYLFRRLGVSSKRITKEATFCSLLAFEQISFSVQDACIEDERQYRAPHLPAGLLIDAMSRVGSSHVS